MQSSLLSSAVRPIQLLSTSKHWTRDMCWINSSSATCYDLSSIDCGLSCAHLVPSMSKQLIPASLLVLNFNSQFFFCCHRPWQNRSYMSLSLIWTSTAVLFGVCWEILMGTNQLLHHFSCCSIMACTSLAAFSAVETTLLNLSRSFPLLSTIYGFILWMSPLLFSVALDMFSLYQVVCKWITRFHLKISWIIFTACEGQNSVHSFEERALFSVCYVQ